MYELHNLIEKLQERKTKFEKEYIEDEELIKVRNVLSKRLVVLREKLKENPSNQSLLLEYGFTEDELRRISERILYLNEKYATKEAKLEKYEKLIDYDIQELFTYVEFMRKFNLDEKLCQALQDSLISLDKNIYQFKELNKEE
ncbi:MAG: hypothetical protein IJJ47_08505 [Methanosphaera sp.]|nr:hypothetical protein [Methanosphaera sp.]